MSYDTSSRYRILEYDRSGRPKTDPEDAEQGVDWPTGDPPKPRDSVILKAVKAVVLVVAVVVLCFVFFSAGEWISDHLITHSPFGARNAGTPSTLPTDVQAARTQAASASSASQAAPAPTQKAPEVSQPPQPPVAVALKQEPPSASNAMHGTIVLQVAALTRQDGASAMATKLQQKQYPAFVRLPTTDNFYRVQVGPYPDLQSANAVKRSLEHDGYAVIIKR